MFRFHRIVLFVLICSLFSAGYGIAAEMRMGKTILFSSNNSGRWDLWTVHSDGHNLKQITRTSQDELFPAVSCDGKQIIYADDKRTLWTIKPDGSDRKMVPLPNGIFTQPSWRPDGREIAFVKYTVLPSDQGEVWRMEKSLNGWKEPELLSKFPPMRSWPSYSPDGRYLAYAEFRRDRILGVIEEIGIFDFKKKKFNLITEDQADSYYPVWSPDGRLIACTSNITGSYEIWIINPVNKKKYQLTHDPSFDGDPAWSLDGEEIAFVSNRTGNREIWIISMHGEQLRQITGMKKTCSHPVWVK